MARKVWIEAALNGPWGRSRQPGIPVTEREIITDGIKAARAGAAIIHVHAYDVLSGRQKDDADAYSRIIEGIRSQADVIVYPTIPISGSPLSGTTSSSKDRFDHVRILASRGLIEMTVVDPGSVNFSSREETAQDFEAFTYLNSEADVRYGLSLSRDSGIRPSFAIYEPGFTRLGATIAAATPGLKPPLYRFMFTDGFAWGFPPEIFGLDAHLKLLELEVSSPLWMIAGLRVDLRSLIGPAVERGGHVRAGLEDAPFGCQSSNLALIEAAVKLVREAGGEPATAAEVRERG